MTSVITAFHLIICFFVIIIVLLQQGRGADVGATFGGGSQTLFGAAGADSLLTRVTTGLAILFMITSVILAAHKYEIMAGRGDPGRIFQNLPTTEVPPAASGAGAPTSATPGAPEQTAAPAAPVTPPVAEAPAAPVTPESPEAPAAPAAAPQ